MTENRYYRPRMACQLEVPIFEKNNRLSALAHGSNSVTIPVVVRSAKLTKNDANHADELSIECDSRDVGLVDPRWLKSCTCNFWLGDAGVSGQLVTSDDNHQFTGVCIKVSRVARGDGGFSFMLDFQDYTSFFIAQKPYVTAGIPGWGDTLETAWKKICDHTGFWDVEKQKIVSSVALLRDRLFFPVAPAGRPDNLSVQNANKDTVIGKQSVLEQIRKHGLPDFSNGKDAWSIWVYFVNALGLMTFIQGDQCIVTTTTEHFSSTQTPVMIWGDNIAELEENVEANSTHKGVWVVSYDGLNGRVLEAFAPPPHDPQIFIKRAKATTKTKVDPDDPATGSYEILEYHGIQDQQTLQNLANRVFEEYSRQGLQGSLKSMEMSTEGVDGRMVDLLKLSAGDLVRVVIDAQSKEMLSSTQSDDAKLSYLVKERGYSTQVANLIIQNSASLQILKSDFHVKTLTVNLSDTEFSIDLAFQNMIDVSGATDDTAVSGSPTSTSRTPNPRA